EESPKCMRSNYFLYSPKLGSLRAHGDLARRIADRPAKVGRAHVHMFGEDPGKHLVRRIPDLVSDLCDRNVRAFEKLAGSLYSQSRQVDSRRHADTLLEHACEMKRRQPRLGCQFVEADVFRKPRPDK